MSGQVYSVPFAQIPEWILDAEISDRAVRTFLVLHRHASKDGTAFPGRAAMAERLRCSQNSLDRALNELREIGAIVSRQRKQGPAIVGNDYWLWPASPSPGVGTGSPTGEATPTPTGGATVAPGVGRQEEREPVNESQRERENTATALTLVAPDPLEAFGFDDFWAAYPRKAGKVAAEKAFAKAVRRAKPAVIVEGALRYRQDPNRDDTFTKHATTWLNGDCWDDPPLPSRTGSPRSSAQGKEDRTMESIGAVLGDRIRSERQQQLGTGR